MPLLLSYQVSYRRMHAWVGATGQILAAPPDADADSEADAEWDALLAPDALSYRLCYGYSVSRYSHSNTMKPLTSEKAAMHSTLKDTSRCA